MVSICFMLISIFLHPKLEDVPVLPEFPAIPEYQDIYPPDVPRVFTLRSWLSIYYNAIILGMILILAINSYYIWKEKTPTHELYTNPSHPQIYGGFLLLMVFLMPIFLFTEFPATYQDIVILLMLIISAILLILSGIIYKKTPLQD